MAERGYNVGAVAEALLGRLACASQHLRVKAKPGHGDERPAVCHAEVNLSVDSGQRDLDRPCAIQRNTEVDGEQVPRASWQDRERNELASKASRACGDGAVAARGDHEVDTSVHGMGGLAGSWIGWRGQQPYRLVPPLGGQRRPYVLLEYLEIVNLDRVDHYRRAAHG